MTPKQKQQKHNKHKDIQQKPKPQQAKTKTPKDIQEKYSTTNKTMEKPQKQ